MNVRQLGGRPEEPGREATVSRFIGGADEGVAVDPTDHSIWINTDTDKGRNDIPGCNRSTLRPAPSGHVCFQVDSKRLMSILGCYLTRSCRRSQQR